MTTLPAWLAGLRSGRYVAESLTSDGFVHLSRPDQVAIPANALFAGRTDLWLLVLDPDRLSAPVRWETAADLPPGSSEPAFPHLYGPVEPSAVMAVVPYQPHPDGSFTAPAGVPARDDRAARATAFERYVATARSSHRTPVPGGVCVRSAEFPASYDHNRLILDRPVDVATAHALSARELYGLEHWQLSVLAPVDAGTVADLVAAGWDHSENLLMVATDDPVPANCDLQVHRAELPVLADFRRAMRGRYLPGASVTEVQQLIDREVLTERVAQVEHLVVADGPVVAAQADLYVVGATAQVESVDTDPSHRGRGYATALVLDGLARARARGCDLVFLLADANDWPQHLYEKLGFRTIASSHVFDRQRPRGLGATG